MKSVRLFPFKRESHEKFVFAGRMTRRLTCATIEQNLCVLSHARAAASPFYALLISVLNSLQNQIDSFANGHKFTWTL